MECIDRIVGGGFPVGGMISVSGPCGAGKTLFALEYLIRGAMAGEKGLYISTVHDPDKLETYLPKLDYADDDLFENERVVLRHIDEMGSGERDEGRITKNEALAMVSDITQAIEEVKAGRMVLDATNPILVEMEGWVARSFLLSLSKALFEAQCTGLLITEGNVEDCQEHIMSDGIIKLGTAVRRGDNYRVIEVLKMSGGAHSRAKYVMDMTSQGLLITPMLRGF
jgi:circadian clock protein KaiC